MLEKGKLCIYACGGCGTNLVLNNLPELMKQGEGVAEVYPCFVDTSLSNLNDRLPKEHKHAVYTLKGTDGSGKIRSSNYDKMLTSVDEILLQLPAKDVNLVVFSASGGSGSVLGPLLLKRLLENNQVAVGLVIGDDATKIMTTNSINTLRSLDGISRNLHQPIVCSYFQNQKGLRKEVDYVARSVMNCLRVLCSRQNRELDSADVRNFLSFQTTTSVKEGLTLLYVLSNSDTLNNVDYPISSVSLYPEGNDTPDNIRAEYSCEGFLPTTYESPALHFITSQTHLPDLVNELESTKKKQEEYANARVSVQGLAGDASDDNGMVL